MALVRRIEVQPLMGEQAGTLFFSAPRRSDETLIAEVAPWRGEAAHDIDLYCHRFQTDQLMVLKGSIELLVLQERTLRRLTLREDEATWVRIPPGVPHGAINRHASPAVVVNAVLRHGPSDPRDYRPRRVPAHLLGPGPTRRSADLLE